MDCSILPLLPRLAAARTQREPLVLATVIETRGSTYRKPGAQMLLAGDGGTIGLLSGGCLEADLAAHAERVLTSGTPRLVTYEHAGADDSLWGLGSGCEGGMDIWLTRLESDQGWTPLTELADALQQRATVPWAAVLQSRVAALPAGAFLVASDGDRAAIPPAVPDVARSWIEAQLREAHQHRDPRIVEFADCELRLFVAALPLPRAVLVLGAGLDAVPLVQFGAALGWHITVADHRRAFADPLRFPEALRVLESRPGDLPDALVIDEFDAVVVMSHHLATDLAYLRLLARAAVPYVGLLGPAARRRHLLDDLGPDDADRLGGRLRAPVGLDLGGRDPASIALSIVAEIQAHCHGRNSRSVDWTADAAR